MRHLIIGVDLDGVLANFVEGFTRLIVAETDRDLFPAGWATDPHFPSRWDWPATYGYTQDEIDHCWATVRASKTFWLLLKPFPDALDLRLTPAGTTIYFLTSRQGTTALGQSQIWVRSHLSTVLHYREHSVAITNHKGLLAEGLHLDALIDDNVPNVLHVWSQSPTTRAYLRDRPYNRELPTRLPPAIIRVTSVGQAVRHLLENAP